MRELKECWNVCNTEQISPKKLVIVKERNDCSIFILHDKYKVGNKNKNKLKSAKRFPNNHRQYSTDKS